MARNEAYEALRKPRQPGEPLDASVVRSLAKQARNNRFYRKLYALELFMAGEFAELAKMAAQERGFYETDEDLGLFPEIDPELGDTGVQNHGLINSRINIQAIAFADPEFLIKVDDPLIREVLAEYFEQLWAEQDLSNKFDLTGMEVENKGFGFCEWGTQNGTVACEPFSALDALWDRGRKTPGSWRYFFIRRRLDLEDAFEEFGHLLSYDRLKELSIDMRRYAADRGEDNDSLTETYPVVPRWNFWHKDTHCVFLGQINCKKGDSSEPNSKSVMLRLNANMEYEVAEEPGPNPFGFIPVSTWIDSWAPGVARPMGKTETTTRMAGMLNRIELAVKYCLDRGLPLTILSTIGMEPETAEKIRRGLAVSELPETIVIDGVEDVRTSIHREAGLPIPPDYFNARSVYKEELNSATGVMDSMRGVIQPGERTAQEMRIAESNGGIQSKHIRKQYQKFLRDSFRVVVGIGALYESKQRVLMLSDGPIDTAYFPLKPLLRLPITPDVREDSLQYTSIDERKQKRMIEFQTVDLAALSAGVGDPMKIFFQLYRDLGVKDPTTRMMSREEYKQRMVAQQLATQQQDQNHANTGQ